MLTKLRKAKNALNQLAIKGEENALLYIIAHQSIDEAIKLEAAKAEAEERLREAEKTAEAIVAGEPNGD